MSPGAEAHWQRGTRAAGERPRASTALVVLPLRGSLSRRIPSRSRLPSSGSLLRPSARSPCGRDNAIVQLRPCSGCARGAPLRAFGSRRFRSWCHPPPRLAGPPGTRCGRKADERLFLVCRQSGRLSAAVAPQPLPLVGPPCSARGPGIGERAAVPAGLKRPIWQVARLRPRS